MPWIRDATRLQNIVKMNVVTLGFVFTTIFLASGDHGVQDNVVWSEWSYSACSATCGANAIKLAFRKCVKGCTNQELKLVYCHVEHCRDEMVKNMCPKKSSIYRAVRQNPIYTDCLVDGEFNSKDNLLNGEFKGSLEDCAFYCNVHPLCQGFSFNTLSRECVPKTDISYAGLFPSKNIISGSKRYCGNF